MATISTETEHNATPVRLNIGGTVFMTSWATLKSVQDTRLADLTTSSPEWRSEVEEFFFDRDPAVFEYILGFYRTGELHLPDYVCASAIQNELNFWNIDENLVWDCCWKYLYKETEVQKMRNELETVFVDHTPQYYDKLRAEFKGSRLENVQWFLWTLVEKPDYSRVSKVWFFTYMSLVVLSTLLLFLQTLPTYRSRIPLSTLIENNIYNNETKGYNTPFVYGSANITNPKLILLLTTLPYPWMIGIGILCLSVFTLDFLLRLSFGRDKLRFCRQWLNWVELFIIVAEWLGFLFSFVFSSTWARVGELCRLVSYFRFFRFYRLLWKLDELRLLQVCLKNCWKELLMLLFMALAASAGFAIMVFVLEINEPAPFTDLPVALWWAIITLTSVGYGDVVPLSTQGRLISGVCAVTGLLLVALPVAVIATNFAEYHRLHREMVALLKRKKKENADCQVYTLPSIKNMFKNKVDCLKKC